MTPFDDDVLIITYFAYAVANLSLPDLSTWPIVFAKKLQDSTQIAPTIDTFFAGPLYQTLTINNNCTRGTLYSTSSGIIINQY